MAHIDPKTFGWAAEFLKAGGKVDPGSEMEKSLGIIRRKFVEDYLPFLNGLINAMSHPVFADYQDQKKDQDRVYRTISNIEFVNMVIGRLIDKFELVSSEDLDAVYQAMESIEKDFKFYSQDQASVFVKGKVKEVEEKMGIMAKKLEQEFQIIEGRVKKGFLPSKMERFKQMHEGIYDLSKTFGAGVFQAVLGPLTIFASPIIKSIAKKREIRRQEERRAFLGAIMPASERMPEEIAEMHSYLYGIDKERIKEGIGRGHGTYEKYASQTSKGKINVGHLTDQTFVKSRFNEDIAKGLESFFTIGAYQSKWTIELMELIRRSLGFKIRQQRLGAAGAADAGGVNAIIPVPIPPLKKALGFLGKKILPMGLAIPGIGMMISDTKRAQTVAKEQGWLGPVGKDPIGGQRVAAGIGGFLGGTGRGLGEIGSTPAELTDQAARGIGKGALIGAALGLLGGPAGSLIGKLFGGFVGGLIGGGVGTVTHMIGGRRIAVGVQAISRGVDWIFRRGEYKPSLRILGSEAGSDKIISNIPVSGNIKMPEDRIDIDTALERMTIQQSTVLREMSEKINELVGVMKKGVEKIDIPKNIPNLDPFNIRDPWIDNANSGMLEAK